MQQLRSLTQENNLDTAPLKAEMMSEREITWLNMYPARVYERLSLHLNENERSWLEIKTRTFSASAANGGSNAICSEDINGLA